MVLVPNHTEGAKSNLRKVRTVTAGIPLSTYRSGNFAAFSNLLAEASVGFYLQCGRAPWNLEFVAPNKFLNIRSPIEDLIKNGTSSIAGDDEGEWAEDKGD